MKKYLKNNWKGLLFDILLLFLILILTEYLRRKDSEIPMFGLNPLMSFLKTLGLAIIGGFVAHHATKWSLKRLSKKN